MYTINELLHTKYGHLHDIELIQLLFLGGTGVKWMVRTKVLY